MTQLELPVKPPEPDYPYLNPLTPDILYGLDTPDLSHRALIVQIAKGWGYEFRYWQTDTLSGIYEPISLNHLKKHDFPYAADKVKLETVQKFYAKLGTRPNSPIVESDWQRFKSIIVGLTVWDLLGYWTRRKGVTKYGQKYRKQGYGNLIGIEVIEPSPQLTFDEKL